MKVLLVDEDFAEVSGLIKFIEGSGHEATRYTTFSDAYMALAGEGADFGLLVIDLMTPWGRAVPDEVRDRFSWRESGLYLVETIRGIQSRNAREVVAQSPELPDLNPDRFAQIPIIVLTKAQALIEDKLDRMENVHLFEKTPAHVIPLMDCIRKCLEDAGETASQ